MEIVAAAARRAADGTGLGSRKADGESFVAGSRVGALNSEGLREDVKHSASTDGFFVTSVRNEIL